MAQLKELLVTGPARFLTKIKADVEGNADTATKATADASGNNIVDTYATKAELETEAAARVAQDADIRNKHLPLIGGNMSGHIYLTGAKESSSTNNTSQIIFGTSENNHVAISSNNNALVINPTKDTTANQIVLYLDKASQFPSGITANVTGSLSGNASTATKATQDASGNTITTTYATKAALNEHVNKKDNPHGVTKTQVGLGNVDNTADKDKSVATAVKAEQDASGNNIVNTYETKANAITGLSVSGKTVTYTKGNGTTGTITTQDTDTKNTAGSTDTSSKIFLIGATSQAANPQTYSHNTTYVDANESLHSTSVTVATKAKMSWNSTEECIDFTFI